MSKAFLKRGQDYLDQKKAEFLKQIIGTDLEQHAITYGIEKSWILPLETLDAVRADCLFPTADLFNAGRKVSHDVMTEADASRMIAKAVAQDSDMHMQAIRSLAQKAAQKASLPNPPEGDGEVTLTGIPEAQTENTCRLYGFRINGRDVYMFQDDAPHAGSCMDKKLPITVTAKRSQWWVVTDIQD